MREPDLCPLCHSKDSFKASRDWTSPLFNCQCSVCGRFSISRDAVADRILEDRSNQNLRTVRALLSHRVRSISDSRDDIPVLSEEMLKQFVSESPRALSIQDQLVNIIRYLGEIIQRDGKPLRNVPIYYGATVGAFSRDYALKLTHELIDRGLVRAFNSADQDSPYELMNIDLTIDGWERFEKEQSGQLQGNYGFLAMKFYDPVLDPFVKNIVKPAVKSISYELIDMRDVPEAGVIDNLMRQQIRDAAFLLVDLTHDNAGAYWEAGYAEGLGKPVIYLCERDKFQAAQTHFDTNHCTTVMWHPDETEKFTKQLIATLRRSLGLFDR